MPVKLVGPFALRRRERRGTLRSADRPPPRLRRSAAASAKAESLALQASAEGEPEPRLMSLRAPKSEPDGGVHMRRILISAAAALGLLIAGGEPWPPAR